MFFPPISQIKRECPIAIEFSPSEGSIRISSVFLLLVLGFPHWWNGRIGPLFCPTNHMAARARMRARTYTCTHVRSRSSLSFTRKRSPPHRGSSLASFLLPLPCFLPRCNRTNSGTKRAHVPNNAYTCARARAHFASVCARIGAWSCAARMLNAKSISSLHRVYVYTWAAKPWRRKIPKRRDAYPFSLPPSCTVDARVAIGCQNVIVESEINRDVPSVSSR